MKDVLPDWLKVFESTLLEILEKTKCRLASNFPDVKISLYGDYWVQANGSDGYIIALSCHWPAHLQKEIDLVDFSAYFTDIRTQPKFTSDVCWAHPSGYIEAEFKGENILFDDATAAEFFRHLPKLIAALEVAITRGDPVSTRAELVIGLQPENIT